MVPLSTEGLSSFGLWLQAPAHKASIRHTTLPHLPARLLVCDVAEGVSTLGGMERSIHHADIRSELRLPAPTRHLGDLGFAHTADESPQRAAWLSSPADPWSPNGASSSHVTPEGGENSSSCSPARSLVCAAIPLAGVLRGKVHGICDLSLSLGGDRPKP